MVLGWLPVAEKKVLRSLDDLVGLVGFAVLGGIVRKCWSINRNVNRIACNATGDCDITRPSRDRGCFGHKNHNKVKDMSFNDWKLGIVTRNSLEAK